MTPLTSGDKRHRMIRHADPQHADVVLVDWMLGNACNYACSYCPSELHDGKIAWQPASDVLNFFDALKRHYTDIMGRQVWLQFTGGEPTMHPRITELLSGASERGFAVSLISNGSRTVRFWEQVHDKLDSVILTYHDETCEHAHFLSVGRLLADVMPIHINITVHPERFDTILERAADIARVIPDASVSLKPLRIGFGTEMFEYTPDQLRRLESRVTSPNRGDVSTPRGEMLAMAEDGEEARMRANEFILRKQNRWQGYLCDAGLESLRVHANGSISRAVCGVGGKLGRLGQPVDLPVSQIVCDRVTCGCVADILITKRRLSAPAEITRTGT